MTNPHRNGHRMSDAAHKPRRVASDVDYLDQLAQRLARDACLPLGLAVRRVRALAVSASRVDDGREDRR
jgi:hypothetical protein